MMPVNATMGLGCETHFAFGRVRLSRVLGAIAAFLTIPFCAHSQDAARPERWVTTFGGGTAQIVTVDRHGRIYIAGTGSTGLPISANAFAPTPVDSFCPQGFLMELDASGASVLYGTYLNGVTPRRIVVDDAGYMYVLGDYSGPGTNYQWRSFDPPITPNAAQTSTGLVGAAVVLKIAPGGELIYGTFAGGMSSNSGGLAVDGSGRAVICGATADRNLPASPGAFQPELQGRSDVYVAILSPEGSRFDSLTYLGAAGADFCEDLRLDTDGNVLIYGDTNSRFFPVTVGAYQVVTGGSDTLFVAKFDPKLEQLLWCTYLGGTRTNRAQSMALAPASGGIVLTGWTDSIDFPVTPGTAPEFMGNEIRPFVSTLDTSGARLLSSFVLPINGTFTSVSDTAAPLFAILGPGVANLISNATLNAVQLPDAKMSGNYVMRFDTAAIVPTYLGPTLVTGTGGVASRDGSAIVAGNGFLKYDLAGVPVRSLGAANDTAVVEFGFANERLPLVTQVLNAASLMPSPVAPGQLMDIRGLGLCSPDVTRVLVDGEVAPIISCESASILALAPTAPCASDSFTLVVERDGVASDVRKVPVAGLNPALFTAANTGSGQALAFNDDGTANSPERPAQKGRRLRIFATGLGGIEPAQITARLCGIPAAVDSVDRAADPASGRISVDIVVPPGAPQGDFLPVQIKAGTVATQVGVTVAVR
jgi:uncharacterized protein (TIGR03437 family)